MKPDQQRIAIAEFCGYTNIQYDWINANDSIKDWMHDKGRGIPDYLNDLNAMHEAEKLIPALPYLYRLQEVCAGYMTTTGDLAKIIKATASQRAEALLRTIGKWTE